MPYKIQKISCKTCGETKCYKVVNKITRRVHAKCTTLANAQKQVRLMHGIDHGWSPRQSKSRSRKQSYRRRSP